MYIINKEMDKILPKFLITLIATLCVFCHSEILFAQRAMVNPVAQENLDELHKQARKYREAGLENQRVGNLAEAMSLYQKAVTVAPDYAVAYNDLGVIYEAMGSPERAEESYLKTLKIDPAYSSVYTNLALFYENQHDLEKAAFYWGKRAQIGSPDDPWTQKASSRLKDIRISKQPVADQREQEVLGLMTDNKTLAQDHFQRAKDSFKRGDLATAIKEAMDAQNLDKDNPEIGAFIEKAELRALSR